MARWARSPARIFAVYGALIRELSRLELAYLHVAHMGDEVLLRKIRGIWPGALVLNRGGADLPTRIADIANGTADVIAVGSMSLAKVDAGWLIDQAQDISCDRSSS